MYTCGPIGRPRGSGTGYERDDVSDNEYRGEALATVHLDPAPQVVVDKGCTVSRVKDGAWVCVRVFVARTGLRQRNRQEYLFETFGR